VQGEIIMASEKLEKLISQIDELTVLELSELVKALEEKYDVTAAAPVAVAAVAAGGEAGGEAAEEKTEFTAMLVGAGDKKIQVIKEVRAITGLGLKEAKELVDSAPKPIKEDVPKEEAEQIKEKVEAAGGSVELK